MAPGHSHVDDLNWEPPSRFDGFAIERLLGRGGMGSVYLAYEESLERKVAIKFVSFLHAGSSGRFLTEARAIARLQHPNVVAVYRFGQVAGRQYLAYEYVDGESLDRLPRPVGWIEVLQIGLDIARGLAAAHEAGVLHRDIKPGNVLRTRSGSVKLLDFGLAKLGDARQSEGPLTPPFDPTGVAQEPETITGGGPSPSPPFPPPSPGAVLPVSETMPVATLALNHEETVTGTLLGTPLYIAPELWGGARATPRSDIYSTGLLLYELAAGTLPFSGLHGSELARRVTEDGVPAVATSASEMPQALASAIDCCVARNPDERFQTAAELVAALEAVDVVFSSFRRLSLSPSAPDDITVVSNSFARATRNMDSFVQLVYDHLFLHAPDLRPLFPADMAEQREKLGGMLTLALHGLRAPGTLLPVLEDLGHRHAPYGVKDAHFDTLEESLLYALQQADAALWTDDTAAAWRRAYGAIAAAMRRGLSRGP